MDNKTKARWKDEILKYLQEEYPRALHIKDIMRIVTKQALMPDKLIEICEEIISDDLGVLENKNDNTGINYKATEKTREFLQTQGGFKKLHSNKEMIAIQEKEKDSSRKELQDEVAQLQRRNLQLRTKTHWIPIFISLFGFVIALASFFRPSNEPSKPVDDNRLQNIEMKMEQLENGLKKDLDSIQNELYEAQMLIDNYES